MKLTEEQKQQFDWHGYLFFPSLFRPEEIKVLMDEVPALYAQRRPENIGEKTANAVRTNFAAHMYSYPFAKLARHPRMVEPIRQLFDEDNWWPQIQKPFPVSLPLRSRTDWCCIARSIFSLRRASTHSRSTAVPATPS